MCGVSAVCSELALPIMDFDLSQPEAPVQCPLCTEVFVVVPDSQQLQAHLQIDHHLVIAKIHQIADLRQYLMYWSKLCTGNLFKYCTAIITNSDKDIAHGEQQLYYLLSDHLPEDQRLREKLKDIKLRMVIRTKEQERADTSFSRKCVYCYEVVYGGLHNVLLHLTNKHSFNIGNPDNIVFGDKLLDAIELKFQKLFCLYCEKKFPHHEKLRIHMRKKGHRTLNPADRFYDQFYLINYLQPGTPWQEVKLERDEVTRPRNGADADDNPGGLHSFDEPWTDWREEETTSGTCLFCPYTTIQVQAGLLQHMSSVHKFDLLHLTRDFSFYDKVRVINFIRAKVQLLQCPTCGSDRSSSADLQDHLSTAEHCRLPTPALWCTDQYLRPTLSEDALLCLLDDPPDEDSATQSECEVFSEDIPTNRLDPSVAWELSFEDGEKHSGGVQCLFCNFTGKGDNAKKHVLQHLHTMHAFDLHQVTRHLEFYEQVRLINYLRVCTARCQCYYCEKQCNDWRDLEEHRAGLSHTGAPPAHLFKEERYMVPVIPGDPMMTNMTEETWTDDSDLEDDVPLQFSRAHRSSEEDEQPNFRTQMTDRNNSSNQQKNTRTKTAPAAVLPRVDAAAAPQRTLPTQRHQRSEDDWQHVPSLSDRRRYQEQRKQQQGGPHVSRAQPSPTAPAVSRCRQATQHGVQQEQCVRSVVDSRRYHSGGHPSGPHLHTMLKKGMHIQYDLQGREAVLREVPDLAKQCLDVLDLPALA